MNGVCVCVCVCVEKGVDERWASGGVKKWCLCACAHVCVGCDVVLCCIEQGNPVTPVRSGPADEHHPSSAHSSASQRRWSVAAEPEDALVVGTVGLFRVSLCSSIKVRPAHSVPVSRVLAICFFFYLFAGCGTQELLRVAHASRALCSPCACVGGVLSVSGVFRGGVSLCSDPFRRAGLGSGVRHRHGHRHWHES